MFVVVDGWADIINLVGGGRTITLFTVVTEYPKDFFRVFIIYFHYTTDGGKQLNK